MSACESTGAKTCSVIFDCDEFLAHGKLNILKPVFRSIPNAFFNEIAFCCALGDYVSRSKSYKCAIYCRIMASLTQFVKSVTNTFAI